MHDLRSKLWPLLAVGLVAPLPAQATAPRTPERDRAVRTKPGEQPPELGLVRWYRDEAAARAAATASGHPLLVLFQEVPG